VYLRENGMTELAALYQRISESARDFCAAWIDQWDKCSSDGHEWREIEVDLLQQALDTEREAIVLAKNALLTTSNALRTIAEWNAATIDLFMYGDTSGYSNGPDVVLENIHDVLQATAKFHAANWHVNDINFNWRFLTEENLISHISMMERDYEKYRADEENGLIPQKWECEGSVFENHHHPDSFKVYEAALAFMKEHYPAYVKNRFYSGKNITVIHGDLNPMKVYVNHQTSTVKFGGTDNLGLGLCTEDLAMLLALHIEPRKTESLPMLKYYHECLRTTVKDYPFDLFLADYKISVAESLFFPIKLIKQGIFDFQMRDKAILAFNELCGLGF
jgi:hypothetical protein